MIALVLDETARIKDVPVPPRLAGEAHIRVRTSGVCDTDLQLARGYMNFRGVPGHEFVGDVIAADDARWMGKRVVADINAGCGECHDCKTARAHHCATRTVLGILGRSGAFAEIVSVPERCLIEVPAAVSDHRAVFAEPLAAALHVVDEIDVAQKPRAIVLGDGKLGQLIARALAGSGIDTTLVGHHRRKLALATAAGISTYEADALPASQRGAPLVVDATGSQDGLAAALDLVAPRGTIVLKTTVAGKASVDLAPVVINEIRVIGSRCGDMARAVQALASGTVDPLPLVEASYPLDRAVEALEHAGRRGTMKILITARVT